MARALLQVPRHLRSPRRCGRAIRLRSRHGPVPGVGRGRPQRLRGTLPGSCTSNPWIRSMPISKKAGHPRQTENYLASKFGRPA